MNALDGRLLGVVRSAFRAGETVLCAVSGGADSVALLRLLKALEGEGRVRLLAAHFEHGMRGEASLADMRFVQALCAEMRVPLRVGAGDVPARAALLRMGAEETARDMRHAFLEGARVETGADVIALAHHADDQAETVLMRLLRGSGGEGAAGMRARAGRLARPLLNVRKRELVQYLEGNGWSWREDATNREEDTLRNALRARVMPELERIRPGGVEAIGRFSAAQAEESDFLNGLAERWLAENALQYSFGTLLRLDAPPHGAVLARALKALCGKDAGYRDIARIRALCAPDAEGFAESDARGFRAARSSEGLWLLNGIEPPGAVSLPEEGSARLGGLGEMTVRACEPVPLRDDPLVQALDARAVRGALLRTWREGDRIRPLGMGGRARLVSDLLGEARVPGPRRPYWPVVEKDGEILWAVGLRISETAKLAGGREAARLAWRPEKPGRRESKSADRGIQETGGQGLC